MKINGSFLGKNEKKYKIFSKKCVKKRVYLRHIIKVIEKALYFLLVYAEMYT